MFEEITGAIGISAQRSFWEDDLQMCLDPWLGLTGSKGHMQDWVDGLTKRQLRILCSSLGLRVGKTLTEQRDALTACNGQLTPYYLVYRFAYRRYKFAVSDYAASVLRPEVIEDCRTSDDKYDIPALLFALYHNKPENLHTIFHLERIHSTGFARMKLKGNARKPDDKTFKEFLTPEIVKGVLTKFDTECRDGRQSEFKNIITHNEHHLVFIRREEHRSVLLKSSCAVHGFRPEWIVLDFHDNGKGVDISSLSMTVPLEIVNHLASTYFGGKREYENEIQITYRQQIVQFLHTLRDDGCDFLTLVEVAVKNSPLDGAPTIRLRSDDGESIGESVRHFERVINKIMDDISQIQSITVMYLDKRVKMSFEPIETVDEGFIVRYVDKTLNDNERRVFVAKLQEEPYGLRILSTEKRHKK